MKKNIKNYYLYLLPLITLCVGSYFYFAIFPLYSGPAGFDQDPAYAYLFNGLLLLNGKAPFHIDHPGTPLQIICAMVMYVSWIYLKINGITTLNLNDSVFNDPELYLRNIAFILAMLNIYALYYLGKKIYDETKNILLSILNQLGMFAFFIVIPRIIYPSPEALIIPISLFILGGLAQYIFQKNNNLNANAENKNGKTIGILYGIGVAVKITFLPMLVLVILINSRNEVKNILKYFVIAFIVFTLPVWKNISRFIDWISEIVTHSGIHGSGSKGIIDWNKINEIIQNLIIWFPFLYYVLFLLFLYIAYQIIFKKNIKKKKIVWSDDKSNGNIKIACALLLSGIIQTLLIIKHPGAHYIMPVIFVPFIGMSWLLYIHKDQINKSYPSLSYSRKVIIILFGMISVAILLYSIAPTFTGLNKLLNQRNQQEQSLALIREELDKHDSPIVICALRCPMEKNALSMGYEYAPALIDENTIQMFSDFYNYNNQNKMLFSPGQGWIPVNYLNKYLKQNKEIFLITPKLYHELSVFKLERLVDGPSQLLMRITGVN